MFSKVLFGFLLASLSASGFLFWQNNVLKENLVKIEAVYERQKTTILEMEKSFSTSVEENSRLQKALTAQETAIDSLRKTLTKHDLTKIAKSKPEILEKKINDATNELFNDITSFTSD